MIDDLVFFTTLVVCISLGSYYKKLDDMEMKRNYGAGLGLLVACLLCGHYIYLSLLMVWGNIIIIKCCDKRYLHQVSLAYTWMLLLYIHWNFSTSHYAIWLHQTIALRVVGLAFEVNMADKSKMFDYNKGASTTKSIIDTRDLLNMDPSAVDIIAYSYYFIGLHKGPYYRWKTFDDHFHPPFAVLGDYRIITEQKLKKAFVCGVACLLLRLKCSSEIYYEEEFYKNNGTDYRYLYNMPQLLAYFLQSQMIMLLCTCVCTETGFGVYPAKCLPTPGHGPTAGMSLLRLASTNTNFALEQEYNFSMLKCFENEKLLIGPKMKHTVRGWDMPTRYWFWAYMYKNFVRANKEVRSACAFLAWTLWCGPTVQQCIVSATMWLFLHLEAEYTELYDTDSSLTLPWNIGFSIMRLFCLIYLTPCLIVEDMRTVLRYYNSIYWVFHILLFLLIILAIVSQKLMKKPIEARVPIKT